MKTIAILVDEGLSDITVGINDDLTLGIRTNEKEILLSYKQMTELRDFLNQIEVSICGHCGGPTIEVFNVSGKNYWMNLCRVCYEDLGFDIKHNK